jgi:hypothetical protein
MLVFPADWLGLVTQPFLSQKRSNDSIAHVSVDQLTIS